MTVKLGNDYLLWIDSAVPGTPVVIKGQGTFSETRSPNKIDTSDKTTAGFNTGAFGNIDWSADLDLKVNLPDVGGYTRLETVSNTFPQQPVIGQLRKNGLAGVAADSVFTASMYWTITSRTFNKDGTVDVKVSLALAAAPTVDVLG